MEQFLNLLLELCKVLLALLALGAATERGTELIKAAWKNITQAYQWLEIRDERSMLLAAVLAFLASYVFGVDVIKYIYPGIDPNLQEIVNALLITLFANKAHDYYGS